MDSIIVCTLSRSMLEPSEGKSVANFADTAFTSRIILLMSTLCFSRKESSYCKTEKKNKNKTLIREKNISCFSLYIGDNALFFESWEKL